MAFYKFRTDSTMNQVAVYSDEPTDFVSPPPRAYKNLTVAVAAAVIAWVETHHEVAGSFVELPGNIRMYQVEFIGLNIVLLISWFEDGGISVNWVYDELCIHIHADLEEILGYDECDEKMFDRDSDVAIELENLLDHTLSMISWAEESKENYFTRLFQLWSKSSRLKVR